MKRNNDYHYGADGLIHDAYGDNSPNHRIGGTIRVYPYWYSDRKRAESSINTSGGIRAKRRNKSRSVI